MLTIDVRFEGWTVTDWLRMLELFTPRPAPPHEPGRPRGGLIVVHDGDRILKLLHTGRGRIEPKSSWPVPLDELTHRHGATFALSLYFGALDDVMERFGARVYRGDTVTDQSLALVTIAREMIAEGAIETWPENFRNFPIPAPSMVERAIDAFCPTGRTFVLGAFHEGDVWTACVLHRTTGGFDVVAGPDELRAHLGLLSGEFRRDYRHLASAVAAKYGPLGFGCFAGRDTLKALPLDTSPGAWARAVAVRDVILSPVPTGIGIAVGLDVARAIFEQVATRFSDRGYGAIDPVLRGVQRGVGAIVGGDVRSSLGFDPLSLLRILLSR